MGWSPPHLPQGDAGDRANTEVQPVLLGPTPGTCQLSMRGGVPQVFVGGPSQSPRELCDSESPYSTALGTSVCCPGNDKGPGGQAAQGPLGLQPGRA